jgi:hypothetical protein
VLPPVIEGYCKWAAWTDQEHTAALIARLAFEGREVHRTATAVCVPLSARIDIGLVLPAAWNAPLCRRPCSWQRHSPLAGQFLWISNEDLRPFGLAPQIRIVSVAFTPPEIPGLQDQQALIARDTYRRAKPAEWDDFSTADPAEQQRWMRVMGVRARRFEDLFLTHCANHANFIQARYFIRDGETIVPYAIGPTKRVCSACLELFNVVGTAYARKLVMPCPGAAIFAGLPVNRYLLAQVLAS